MGLILVKILAPGFYAKQDISTPVKIGVGVLIATQLMNLIFVPWIAHAGLALSIGLGATLNAFFLFVMLRKIKFINPNLAGLYLLFKSLALYLFWRAWAYGWDRNLIG